jgi:Asp/Glu/hydantoin racemase
MTARLALLNANTSADLTARMVALARPMLRGGMEPVGLTAPFGAAYVSDLAASAVAAHAVVEMARGLRHDPPAAAVIACFGDPGLAAARALLPCPVVGMAEASMHAACQIGRRVAIVTGGAAWRPMLEDFVAGIGLSGRLAGVHPVALTGAEIAADPDGAAAALLEALEAAARGGADVAILGGAGLAGLAPRLAGAAPLPLLDSLRCAVAQAQALIDCAPMKG